MNPCLRITALAAVALPLAAAALAAPAAPGGDPTPRAVALLKARCVSCHGAAQQQAGLRVDQHHRLLEGGDSGPAVVPHQPDRSLLLRMVGGQDGKVMPPSGPRLTAAEVALLRQWIEAGAAWPASAGGDPAREHWAYRPLHPRLPGAVRQAGWVRNPIDGFVLRRLEAEGLRPSPPADRVTLIRRLSLDLTGLLPTPEEVDAFLADRSADAYEKVVARLLASPHYGERWGRHWLDLARYADSDGYEKDLPRPYAYLYRDWVIDALNRDLPFDAFTVEQLAGDLLPGATVAQKIATGFHRNTLRNKEGGADQEEDRVKIAVDRTNTTASVWLGLTLACAQCHSHKYDAIRQREYYGLYAFFNSVREVDLPVPTAEETAAYEAAQRAHAAEVSALEARIAAAGGDAAPEAKKLREALAELKKKAPTPPATKAQTLAEEPRPRPTHVLIRGDFLRSGERVEPGTLEVLPPLPSTNRSPTRLDLALWLVSPRNPLTPRVAANRVWQQLFGQGLVRTPDDFGVRGEKPTHPDLLDWLAAKYRKPREEGGLGWSQKELIRLIVTSSTYRQASAPRPELGQRDPTNRLLARQNRFRAEAEVVRDISLQAAGLLNRRIGGPSIRPPLPADIAALGYAGSVKWPETTGPDRYRRGLYIFFQRTVPYPMLATFDAPDGNNACTRRERSNTPLQALTLLNDPVFFECARSLALRILAHSSTGDEGRLQRAFRITVGRHPAANESAPLRDLLAAARAHFRRNPEAARAAGGALPAGIEPAEAASWTAVARALLNTDEFLTRE